MVNMCMYKCHRRMIPMSYILSKEMRKYVSCQLPYALDSLNSTLCIFGDNVNWLRQQTRSK